MIYRAEDVARDTIDGDTPGVTCRKEGREQRIEARFIIGCDGFHGPSRQAIPASFGTELAREYPFGWLGILAEMPPCNDAIISANRAPGFALASMRSLTRSRDYIDMPEGERLASIASSRAAQTSLTEN